MKYYRDLKNVIDTSEEVGFEKGIFEGRVEEKKERDFEIVTNMHNKGVDIKDISLFTNISIDRIKESVFFNNSLSFIYFRLNIIY
jgi:predicted transposase YdaD